MQAVRTASEVDVCLVGLGATGAITAFAITLAGREVLALEAGPTRGSHDIVMDELLATSYRNVWGTSKFNSEVPTWRTSTNSPRNRRRIRRIENGLGGNSVPYAGLSLRFHPDDFKVRSSTLERYGRDALPPHSDVQDWPVGYDELEPYYDATERLLGVAGQAGNIRGEIVSGGNPFEGPRQRPYSMPALRSSGFGGLFREASSRAGYHPFPMPAAILTEPRDGREACTYCSFCSRFACHVDAKGSVLTTVLPRAISTGKLTIRTGCRVVEVKAGDRGAALGVEYECDGRRIFQPAHTVILASYIFENIRLLLLSRSRQFPQGLANNAGQVGRGYMTRQQASVLGVFEGVKLNRFAGPLAQAEAIDDLNADHFDHTGLAFIRGGRISAFNQFTPIDASGRIPPDVRRWGQPYKDFLCSHYNSVGELALDAETLPYDTNYLDLDPDVRDPLGFPVVRITFDIRDNEQRLITYLQARASALMKAMGAPRPWCTPVTTTPLSTHDVGGARMGADSRSSVVDSYGEAYEAPGVFILGGATFPSLPGLNPTLTMQALALRTGVHISGLSLKQLLSLS